MNLKDAPVKPDKDDFGFTENDVVNAISAVREEIAAIQNTPADAGNTMFGGPQALFSKAQRQLAALKSTSPVPAPLVQRK